MRIAVVCEYPTLLGGERSLLAVEPALKSLGCELIWLAPDSGRLAEELDRRDCEFIPFSIRDVDGSPIADDMVRDRFNAAIETARSDLLHGNSLAMARRLGRLAEALPVPTTGHLRDIISLSQAAVDDLNRSRRLIAVSHATRDFHISQGVDAVRITVVHNGVDVAALDVTPQIDIRQQLGLPTDAFLVATIGQIGLRKGQTVFAESAVIVDQIVDSSHDDRPIHYLLIGERYSDKAESREFDERITSIFAEAGLQQRFHRLGYRDDVPDLLQQVDVVVHPARQEPLGRVLLEAAAAGRAIVATDVGGTREIVTHESSALLVLPDDAHQMAAEVVRLYRDESLRSRLGSKAREVVRSRFTLESCASGCLQLWKEVMDAKN